MGVSRRKFAREMKWAAIQQLDRGSSAAEVARAFEINPNLLHRWRNEFCRGPANAFPGPGKRRWDETKVAQRERKVGQ
ncbi:MAG: transposase [Nitrospirota bacterium]